VLCETKQLCNLVGKCDQDADSIITIWFLQVCSKEQELMPATWYESAPRFNNRIIQLRSFSQISVQISGSKMRSAAWFNRRNLVYLFQEATINWLSGWFVYLRDPYLLRSSCNCFHAGFAVFEAFRHTVGTASGLNYIWAQAQSLHNHAQWEAGLENATFIIFCPMQRKMQVMKLWN